MESEESFEVTFKSRPSTPHHLEADRVATPALDPYSSSQASDIAQPVNQNQFDVIMSLMQNVNEKLLGMTNEYQKLREHVNNLEKEVKSPIYDRGDNHHFPNSRPIYSSQAPGQNQVHTDPLHELEHNYGCNPQDTHFPLYEMDRNENRVPNHFAQKPNHVTLKPQTFDGSEDFDEYLTQFEILCDLHGWDYRTKSLYLASSLTGGARALLSELNGDQRRDFNSLVKILNRRYGSVERSEMYRAQLKTKTRGSNETLPELAQSIKKLTRKAYPTADQTSISILALDQFIDALPDPEMRLRLREAKPRDINEAEILAIRLETYRLADAQRVRTAHEITSNEIDPISSLKQDNQNLRKDLQSLTQEIRALTRNGQKPTQNFAQNSHASYSNQGSYQNPYRPNYPNQKPTNYGPKPQGSPNQRNHSNGSNYPNNSRPFQPRRQGNYPMSNSGVGSRQFQGAGPNNSH